MPIYILIAALLASATAQILPGLTDFRGSSKDACEPSDPTCRVVCQDKPGFTGVRGKWDNCAELERWGAGRTRKRGQMGVAPWADRVEHARAVVDREGTSAVDACCFFGGGSQIILREARPLFDANVDVKAAKKVVPAACADYLATSFPSIGDLTTPGRGHVGDRGGYWTACTHLDIYGLNFASFLARHIAYGLRPRTVLEFGCGLGTTSDFLARHVPGGAHVVCLEPSTMLGEVFASKSRVHPSRPYQLAVDVFDPAAKACARDLFARKFDLVLSFEVAEHLDSDRLAPLVERLAAATGKYLVFSAARPKQGGTGHIDGSMKPREWWIDQFERQGLVYLPMLSDRLKWSAKPDREYDLGPNLIAMGVPGAVDRSDVPPEVGGGCASYGHKFCTFDGDTYAATYTREQRLQEMENEKHRRSYHRDSQAAALWPELHAIERALKAGTLSCSSPAR